HTGAVTLQIVEGEARVGDRLEGGFEHYPLLRIHQLRLTGGDAEGGAVERLPVPDESAGAADLLEAGVVDVVCAQMPFPVRWRGRDDVRAPMCHLPDSRRAVRARQARADPDDGDPLIPSLHRISHFRRVADALASSSRAPPGQQLTACRISSGSQARAAD